MKTGIVIGKFFPLHKGHIYLISYAAAKVDQLTVVVCEHDEQNISGQLRARWISELFPQVSVQMIPDNLPADDSKAWADRTLEILGFKPDFVFTSEDYGDAYAKFMGSKHIPVDKERFEVPISGTKVRENPIKYWEYLEVPVRAFFAKRICVIGADSTGTTTMAIALAQHFNTTWVPEYGRTFYDGKRYSTFAKQWRTEDFVHIAKMQNAMEDQFARKCNKLLICDTDSFATSIWHERYMGFISDRVENESKDRNYDLYLLTDVDIPFEQDGTRDEDEKRIWMHNRFLEELQSRNKPYILLSGSHEERLKKAVRACEEVLEND